MNSQNFASHWQSINYFKHLDFFLIKYSRMKLNLMRQERNSRYWNEKNKSIMKKTNINKINKKQINFCVYILSQCPGWIHRIEFPGEDLVRKIFLWWKLFEAFNSPLTLLIQIVNQNSFDERFPCINLG